MQKYTFFFNNDVETQNFASLQHQYVIISVYVSIDSWDLVNVCASVYTETIILNKVTIVKKN